MGPVLFQKQVPAGEQNGNLEEDGGEEDIEAVAIVARRRLVGVWIGGV